MEPIELAVNDFPQIGTVYTGQEITFKMTARIINRELEDGIEYIQMIPEVLEMIRDERKVNPSEILLAGIDKKLGLMNSPTP
jgi:hypothetical protein